MSAHVCHPLQPEQKVAGMVVLVTDDLISSKSSETTLAQVEVWLELGCLWFVGIRQYSLSALSTSWLGCQAAKDSECSASQALVTSRAFQAAAAAAAVRALVVETLMPVRLVRAQPPEWIHELLLGR